MIEHEHAGAFEHGSPRLLLDGKVVSKSFLNAPPVLQGV